jgi:hypothetical protein
MKKSAAAKGKIHSSTEQITKQTESEQPRTKSASAQNKICSSAEQNPQQRRKKSAAAQMVPSYCHSSEVIFTEMPLIYSRGWDVA